MQMYTGPKTYLGPTCTREDAVEGGGFPSKTKRKNHEKHTTSFTPINGSGLVVGVGDVHFS